MVNFSTLIYFVNNLQSDLEKNETNFVDDEIENLLTSMEVGPSENSMNNILSFSRSYEVLETENAGYVEMNLN